MDRVEQYRFNENELTINWCDGRQSKLAAIWLRDHCQMPQSRDPLSGQKLLNVTDIPVNIAIADVTQASDNLLVDFAPVSHQSKFSIDWLLENCYCLNNQTDERSESAKTLWVGDTFDAALPRQKYSAFCEQAEVKVNALQTVKDYGFVILEKVPCREGEILDVISTFGFVRNTNYGSLFDVRSKVDANNLAFTNMGLGCHLDNPYRDPVPGLQLLHCLQSSISGGESILQDGFMAANILCEENPQNFDILCKQWVNFHFKDEASNLHSRVAMIEVNDNDEVIRVRYNNRSIDTLKLHPDQVQPFYTAYRHYAEILERRSLQIRFKLNPGELMIFDNTRILHARCAYSQEGTRHLQGAYSDLDGLYSTLNILKSKKKCSIEGTRI